MAENQNQKIEKKGGFHSLKWFIWVILITSFMPFATATITEVETNCDVMDCYTILETDLTIPIQYIDRTFEVDKVARKLKDTNLDIEFNWKENAEALKKLKIKVMDSHTIKIFGNKEPDANIYWGLKIGADTTFWNSTWWNDTFRSCENITLLSDNVGTNLTDVPYYIKVTWNSNMTSNFQDIRFVDQACNITGTSLPFEVENYTDSGIAHFWVNVPTLTPTSTLISMYYKNNTPVASAENITGTWRSDFVAVHHMNEISGTQLFDSTNNNNDADCWNGASYNATGQIDGSIFLDGNNDFCNISVDNSLDVGSVNGRMSLMAVGLWDNSTVFTQNPRMIGGRNRYFLALDEENGIWSRIWSSGSPIDNARLQVPEVNQWFMATLSKNATGLFQWFNSSLVNYTTFVGNVDVDTGEVGVGSQGENPSGSAFWDGQLDEWRIIDEALSEAEIKTTYGMIFDQANYVTFGTPQEFPTTTSTSTTTTTTPIITTTSPLNVTVQEIVSFFCLNNNRLVRNRTLFNGTIGGNATYIEQYNVTVCEYNCTETLLGTRCASSPTVNGLWTTLFIIVGLIAIVILYEIFKRLFK